MRHAFALFVILTLAMVARSTAQNPGAQNTPDSLTAAYNQAMQAKDWPQAVAAAQQLVGLKATSLSLKFLANAQLYSGSADEALVDLRSGPGRGGKGKARGRSSDGGWKNGLSQILIGKGNALLRLKRNDEAIEAYNQSAVFAANQGLAYFNVCAVLYNIGNTKDSAAACRKCVQADPTRANAWFVLGSDLFADLPVTAQGKVQASPETREALEKYLALAPDGPHAADVKAMLEMIAK